MVIHAITVRSTTSAASVVSITELKTKAVVSQPSTSDASNKEQLQLKAARRKAQEAQAAGTHQLKRKVADSVFKIPLYKRGFIWKSSMDSSSLSPSALATETAPPLAAPLSHLLDDPLIQSTLYTMRNYIYVEPPSAATAQLVQSRDR